MIAIIDYRAGNLTSVKRALEHLGHRNCEITDRSERLRAADRMILPGVGAAGATMHNLREPGLDSVVREHISEGKPFLGICIGIQVLLERSDEDGGTPCLGIVGGRVARYPNSVDGVPIKVPQIGWNRVRQTRAHPIFDGVPDNTYFYFVNSYYPIPDDPSVAIASSDHGIPFTAAIANRNVIATQFHLEKSGAAGLRFLDNFCRLETF